MPQPTSDDLADAVIRLGLQPDGDPFRSLSSLVCLVMHDGQPAFLKVTNKPEELVGLGALEQWDGNSAVRVLVRDGNAILLERVGETLRSLVTDDASATQVLCDAAQRLHGNSPKDLSGFPTLHTWFSSLFRASTPWFDQVRVIADRLLEHSTTHVLLHGDEMRSPVTGKRSMG
jgi:streptomycin 6-kinase